MPIRPSFAILAGAVVCVASAYALAERAAPGFVERLETQSDAAIADAGGEGVSARFVNINGSPTRHPVLEGGGALNEATRARVARAVYDVPGVGGVVWSDGTLRAESDEPTYQPLHCQEDVEGLLRTQKMTKFLSELLFHYISVRHRVRGGGASQAEMEVSGGRAFEEGPAAASES